MKLPTDPRLYRNGLDITLAGFQDEDPDAPPLPFRVLGANVLCHAILDTDVHHDGSGRTEAGLVLDDEAQKRHTADILRALYFVILAVGPDVKETALKPGRLCIHTSSASDPLDWANRKGRLVVVHEEDIPFVWDERAMIEAAKREGILQDAPRIITPGA